MIIQGFSELSWQRVAPFCVMMLESEAKDGPQACSRIHILLGFQN